MNSWKLIILAINSVIKFPRMALGTLHLRGERVGQAYKIEKAGTYIIFRETVSDVRIGEKPVVLVVGFRLKLIGSNRVLHWLFQRICILTTPFWCGFRGFKIKLWMVDTKTKNYLGIYQWLGEQNVQTYINFLTPVLRFFSVKNSVWRKCFVDMKLDQYLSSRAIQEVFD